LPSPFLEHIHPFSSTWLIWPELLGFSWKKGPNASHALSMPLLYE
jgi:hypothetical protein